MRRTLQVILSAGLQIVIFPLHGPLPMWRSWLAWIALVPLLLAILAPDRPGRAVSPLRAALLGYLCGVLFYAGNCYWIYQTMYLYGGMGKPFALLLLLLFSLYLGLYHALFGWLLAVAGRRGRTIWALGSAPFLWVAVELARAHVTGFPWDQLGMSQIDHPALTTLAPAGGVYAISFVLAWISASVALVLLYPKLWKLPAMIAVLCAAMLMLAPRNAGGPRPEQSAILLQPNALQDDDRAWVGGGYADNMQRYVTLSEHPPRGGNSSIAPDVVVWPESPSPLFEQEARFRSVAADLAKVISAPVILGAIGNGTDPVTGKAVVFNSASFFTAQGEPAGRYDKMHLVPFGEYVPFKSLFGFAGGLTANVGNMAPGSQRVMFHTGGHTYGVFICYESIFADEIRLLAKNGADVLVNISDDGWYGDTAAPWQHLNMARMRAIENRRWLLRDTNTGITAAIDPNGQIVEAAPRHTLTAIRVPFAFDFTTTFYTRHGDWFAWMCCAMGALFLVFARRPAATAST